MVEYSLAGLTTVISTIAVIMASIFVCCWCKKGAGETNERKPKKSKREEAAPEVPTAGKSENGLTAIPSVSQCEMKVPLLSSPALEDAQDDLGDFSAVQRETDILRTYRKAKPPKRARQSRAPRALQTGRDSQDVFTQLNEDDSIHGSDKENTDSTDDIDSVLLHQDKRKSQRDTCSSMLADIEQTLADLHVNESSTGSTMADDKSRITGQAPQDNYKDKAVTKKRTELETNSSSQSKSNTSPPHPNISSEVKTQPLAGKESPKVIPTAKPRKIPKVSHKPSPKPRSKLDQDDRTTENTVLEKSSEAEENVSIRPSHQRAMNNTRSLDITPQVKFLPQPTNTEKRTTLAGLLPKATSSSKKSVSDNKTMTDVETTHAQSKHESTQVATPTSPVMREGKKFVDKTNSPTTTSSSEDTESSDAACTTETHTTDKAFLKDTVANSNRGTNMNRKTDSHSGNKEKLDKRIINNEDTGDPTNDQVNQNETPKSTMTDSDEQPARVTRQTSSDRDTSPSQHGDDSRGRSEETRKQRRESNEDQTGKGKTSKIPVRAGSKPRSTSPKMPTTDKTTSVDN